MSREHRLCRSGCVVVSVLLAGIGCRGAEFQLGAGAPEIESCTPQPDTKAGAGCGVFVRTGATGDGTPDAPVGSIADALTLGEKVYVCGDLIDEVVRIEGDAQIIGGLDCDSWAYDLDARTELTAPAGEVPLSISDDLSVTLVGFRVAARNALAGSDSSIAVVAGAGSDVTFERCDLVAGNAADGDQGTTGEAGDAGESGDPGSPSVGGTGGLSTCLSEGGKGGNPGTSSTANGSSGLPSSQINGGALGCTSGGSGYAGLKGEEGVLGVVAAHIDASGYAHDLGAAGEGGTRGGGGGGGGGIAGAGGGGGGAGGCPGGGGEPGGFGGASIALVSLRATLSFVDSTAVVGNGGDGGVGGVGGDGGSKGFGGSAFGAACSGGAGGSGGDGGKGAEGVGGPSLIVAYLGEQPSLNGLEVTAPSAGQAGESPSGELASTAIAMSFDGE